MTSQTTNAVTQFCTSCGQPGTAGRFCAYCGAQLGDDAVVVPAQATGDNEATVVLASSTLVAEDDLAGLLGGDGEQDDQWAGAVSRTRWLASAGDHKLVVVGSLVALAVLAFGGFRVFSYMADADARHALDSSRASFSPVITRLASASDAQQVAAAASAAGPAAERVSASRSRLGTVSGAEMTAIGAQIDAEKALLLAASELQTVASDPLKSWGATQTGLLAAVAAETKTRAALAHFRSVGSLPDTAAMMTRVTTSVGAALVADAATQSTSLLTTLAAAENTRDLRKLGDTAGPEQSAVSAAAAVLPSGEGKQVLTGYGAALGALSRLSKIDGDHTGDWTAARAELALTFGQVAAATGSAPGAQVRMQLDSALAAADKVVQRATAAMADWKAKTDTAVKARTADGEALDSYTSFFTSETKTYETLRQDLSTFTKRVADPTVSTTYYEAYQFLSDAVADRRNTRDVLVAMTVPAAMQSQHDDVVAAIDRSISAVQSAYDGAAQAQSCEGSCYYRDTAGWQTFLSESDAIGKEYAAAMTGWSTAAGATKTAIANRDLPTRPVV